jgi:serine/arginine repetitive matrix protein 2
MHNGIGLATPRGTATNGYVQRNIAYKPAHKQKRNFDTEEIAPPKERKPNQAILEHQRKREVELKLTEWAEENHIFDLPNQEEIDTKLAAKRQELTRIQASRGSLSTTDK